MPKPFCHAVATAALLLPAISLAELAISGVGDELERNLRAYIALVDEDCDADAWRIRRRYRAMPGEARRALEPFGYYSPAVETSLQLGGDCWQATLDIDPGEPVRLRNVDLRISGGAATDASFADLRDPPALRPGSVLSHAAWSRYKEALVVRAADFGYFDADFDASTLDVWPAELATDAQLHFDSGSRYRLGDISVEQDFLDPAIVAGLINLEPGTLYDSRELTRAYRDLSESGYFGRISVTPERDRAEDGRVPIRVILTPGFRIEYTVGAGISTDTGPRLRGGFRNNRLNHDGHRLIADLELSPVLNGLVLEYRIPLRDPRREWFSITGAVSSEKTDTFDNDVSRLGLRWTDAISEFWLRTLSLDLSRESFAVGSDIDVTTLVVPAVAWDHKRADRDVFPRRGLRLGAKLRGTDEAIGSSSTFLQATAWVRWIRGFGESSRVFARLNVGATVSSDFERLPPSVRFFAGGDESVRGFDYESLGPTDANGTVIGGTNLLVASLEYERHLRGNFYGAVFVDAGNAFDDTDFEAEIGAGLGLKWLSPLGPVRVYFGYPVSDSDRNIRLHLRLGADL